MLLELIESELLSLPYRESETTSLEGEEIVLFWQLNESGEARPSGCRARTQFSKIISTLGSSEGCQITEEAWHCKVYSKATCAGSRITTRFTEILLISSSTPLASCTNPTRGFGSKIWQETIGSTSLFS